MSTVLELIDSLDLDVSEMNKLVKELKRLELSKTGEISSETLRKIRMKIKDITSTLAKLNKSAEKSKMEKEKNAIQEYIARVDALLDDVKVGKLGGSGKFSPDYDAFGLAHARHLVEVEEFVKLRDESESKINSDYFSAVGKKSLERIALKVKNLVKSNDKLQKGYLRDVALFKKKVNESFAASHQTVRQMKANLPTGAWYNHTYDDIPNVKILSNQIYNLGAAIDGALSELSDLYLLQESDDSFYGENGLFLMNYIDSLVKKIKEVSNKFKKSYDTELKLYVGTQKEKIGSSTDAAGGKFDETLWKQYLQYYNLNEEEVGLFNELKDDLMVKSYEKDTYNKFKQFLSMETSKSDILNKMMKRYKQVISLRRQNLNKMFLEKHKNPDLIVKSSVNTGLIEVTERNLSKVLTDWTKLFERKDGAFYEYRGMVYFIHILQVQKDRLAEIKKMFTDYEKKYKKYQKELETDAMVKSKVDFVINDNEGNFRCYSSSENGSCSGSESSDEEE